MSIFKSTFDAIGTGSGVAWPSFGILAAALSLGIGGAAMATLGSLCCGLFLLVGLRVFYLAYKKSRLEESRLNEKLGLHLPRFIEQLYDSYLNQDEQPGDFFSYLSQFDCKESEQPLNLQVQFLEFIKQNKPQFFRKYSQFSLEKKEAMLKEIIAAFLNSSDFEETIKSPSNNELLDNAFLSFVGVFGAAAGGTSGVIGVLVGIGLFSGFGAIPILAAVVLTTALLLAVCGAVISIHSNIETHKKTQIYKNFKAFNGDFMTEMIFGDTEEDKKQLQKASDEAPTALRDWRSTAAEEIPEVARVRATLFHLYRQPSEQSLSHLEYSP